MSIRGNERLHVCHALARGRNVDRVYRVLIDIENYPRWWPEVYLQVEPLTPLKKTIGDRVRLLTRGKLPYKSDGNLRSFKRIRRTVS